MVERSGCDRGNLNFDFLIGLMVFILAFMFVVNAIPGIFMPYTSNLVDLGSVTYRTSCILAEDPGWYNNPANGAEVKAFSNWEAPGNIDHVSRVGLAVDKRSPNVLSLDKINALNNNLSYLTSRDKLGLNGTIVYNYSLVIDEINGTSSNEILNVHGMGSSGNVDSLDRIVLIRDGEGLYLNSTYTDLLDSVNINRTPRLDGKVTVRLAKHPAWNQFTNNVYVSYYLDSSIDENKLVKILNYQAGYYSIYKNNKYVVDPNTEGCKVTDTIDIVIDTDAIKRDFEGMEGLSAVNVYAGGCIPDKISNKVQAYTPENPYYEYFNSKGIMRLEVWQE